MISNEGELDTDNKLNNYLKIISILTNGLDHKIPLRKQE
jgi:hypothetical protein